MTVMVKAVAHGVSSVAGMAARGTGYVCDKGGDLAGAAALVTGAATAAVQAQVLDPNNLQKRSIPDAGYKTFQDASKALSIDNPTVAGACLTGALVLTALALKKVGGMLSPSTDSIQKQTAALREFSAAKAQYVTDVNDLTAGIGRLTVALGTVPEAANRAKEALATLSQTDREEAERIVALRGRVEEMKTTFSSLAEVLKTLPQAVEQGKAAFQPLGQISDEQQGKLTGVLRSIKEFAQAMNGFNTTALAGMPAAIQGLAGIDVEKLSPLGTKLAELQTKVEGMAGVVTGLNQTLNTLGQENQVGNFVEKLTQLIEKLNAATQAADAAKAALAKKTTETSSAV